MRCRPSDQLRERFDAVVLGYELGISLALEHLTGLGHRRIGFVGPAYKLDDRRQPAPEVRRSLFIRLMEGPGLLDRRLLLDCPMDAEAAARLQGLGHQVRDTGALVELDDPWGNLVRLSS